MLGLKESLNRMAKVSSMRWYGHALRREKEYVLLKALQFELLGRRGREQPKQNVEKPSRKDVEEKWNGEGRCIQSR